MARSLARRAAMQLLYERLSGGEGDQESLDMVYEQLSEEGEKPQRVNLTPEDRAYIDDVLQGVQDHQQELDDQIASHSTGEWTISRVPHVDLSILRLAAYEMLHRSDVPDNVAISEAMELASRYSEPRSSRYINGVLGAMERDKQEG